MPGQTVSVAVRRPKQAAVGQVTVYGEEMALGAAGESLRLGLRGKDLARKDGAGRRSCRLVRAA